MALPLNGAVDPLPEGANGIAAEYLHDSSIASDSAVIFADDFESYSSASELSTRWNGGVYHHIDLAASRSNVFAGDQSLQFRNPKTSSEVSNTVDRLVNPELDVLFLRYYQKFDVTFNATGSSHNGCSVQASYIKNGSATPGVKADGYNKFLANCECWRGDTSEPSPGRLNVYIYHPEQRDVWGDHFFPTGTVLPWSSVPGEFGPDFVSRPDMVPELGRWNCYEFMVKANTPGSRDGRIACWFDGELVADFMNLRLRDTDTLTIDRFGVSSHIKSNTSNETFVYYDNVVAATTYVGPIATGNAAVFRGGRERQARPGRSAVMFDLRGRIVAEGDRMQTNRTGVWLVSEKSGGPHVIRVINP
ncbi:MAG: hypothetical protein GF410_17600 [Chitinivibrionales bacterium]|nr:hypothetical protein [Chitinivibrionales bacterium]